MNSLSLLTLNNVVVAGVAFVATLTVEHGWKWVVAKAKAYAQEAQAEAEKALEVTNLKDRLDKIEQKLGL